MATFNIETTIASGSYHKRSTGMTGQVLASAEIEAKLARVESLYREVYGVQHGPLQVLSISCLRLHVKARQMSAATCSTWRRMQQALCLTGCTRCLGKQVRRKKQRELFIDAGQIHVYNLRNLARSKGGRKAKEAA